MKYLFAVGCVVLFAPVLSAQTYTFSVVSGVSSYSPNSIAIDGSGAIYGVGFYGDVILKYSPNGDLVARYENSSSGNAGGTDTSVPFKHPRGFALDSSGNLFVADSDNHTIRKITPTGVVTTLAGAAGDSGNADGTGATARFSHPQGLVIDTAGNLFATDTDNHVIRKVTPAGLVTTFAGATRVSGGDDGTGAAARFNSPLGLAIDNTNNLYVADTSNHTIRKITPAAVVTTIAGSASNFGAADGAGTFARFHYPNAVTVDAAGIVFVADTGNYAIRKISGGVVTTVGGLLGIGDGDSIGTVTGSAEHFYKPHGIAVDMSGKLFVDDTEFIKAGTPSSQLDITVQPQPLTVASGSPANFTVTATGAAPFSYQWRKNGTAISGATSATFTIANPQSSDAAAYSVLVTNPVGSLLSTNSVLSVLSASLPNDSLANAQAIAGSTGQVSGSNNGATGEPGEPTHSSTSGTASSVWYKWTPTQTGTVIFDTKNSDTAFGAYTGNSLTTLTRLVATVGPRIGFHATSGNTYYLALGSGYSFAPLGDFTLSWRMILNDDFANAQVISGNSGSVTGNNDGATSEPGEHSLLHGQSTTTLWYRWTPAQDGVVSFSTLTLYATAIQAYSGDSLLALTAPESSASDFNGTRDGNQIQYSFVVRAGVTYSIVVGNYGYLGGSFTLAWQFTSLPVFVGKAYANGTLVKSGGDVTFTVTALSATPVTIQWRRDGGSLPGATGSPFTLKNTHPSDSGSYVAVATNSFGSVTTNPVIILTVLAPPPNDNFANAIAISGLSGTTTGTNINATGETGEPLHWNLYGTASSVWYKWTPPASGLASIDTVGSNFDTVMAVYTGATLTNLTRVTQDDDRGGGRTSLVTFAATSDTTYYIAIGGSYFGLRGNITFNWQLTSTLAVTVPPASATVVAGGSATFSVTATGSGVTYQWNRNATPIPGATQPTLTVTNIQGGADASYTVTITNSTGSVTSAPATLTVAAPALTNLTIKNTRPGGGMLWSVAAGGGTIVAVGDGGVIISSTDNGATWAPRVSGTANWIVGVTYGAGKFVAVADRGLILLSIDGITWMPAASTGTAQRMNNVIYADGKFVAVGEGGTILTSTDANTWTPRVSNTTNWLHGLAYNATVKTFAVSGQGGIFLYSSDGATWTTLPITGLASDLEATVAVDSYAHFVSIGADGIEVSVSQSQVLLKTGDAPVTWNGSTNQTGSAVRFRGLAQGASALFATGEGGKVVTAQSDAGPWFTLSSGTTANLLAGIYYKNSLFIVGEDQTVIQSDPLYASRLINISTRGTVGGSNETEMVCGFVITGAKPKQVLLRGVGPTLTSAFGLTGTLTQAGIALRDSKGTVIADNPYWTFGPDSSAIAAAAARVGAFPFPTGSGDSAILTTLPPGLYTLQVSSYNGTGTNGLALVEFYDADAPGNDTSRVVNLSTRGVVGTGAKILIAGFVIDGASSRRVLIRAVGPGLAAFGLTDALAEPQIELHNGKGLLNSTATAWGLQPNADEIRGAFDAAGAFKLAEGSKDAAMVVTLLPGAWTVQVSGANGGTGVALIEVYALP